MCLITYATEHMSGKRITWFSPSTMETLGTELPDGSHPSHLAGSQPESSYKMPWYKINTYIVFEPLKWCLQCISQSYLQHNSLCKHRF